MTLLQEIKALAAELLADGRVTNEADARQLATVQIDAMLRFADKADGRLTSPKMEAINVVAAALCGQFPLLDATKTYTRD